MPERLITRGEAARDLNVPKKFSLKVLFTRWEMILVYLLIIIYLMGVGIKPKLFLSPGTVSMIIQSGVDKAVLSLGMYALLGQGDRDMSCGGLVLMLSMIIGVLYEAGVPFAICFAAALFVAVVAELFSASLVEILKFNSVIVGIALGILYRGIVKIMLNDRVLTTYPEWFLDLSWNNTLGGWIPVCFVAFLAIACLFYMVMHKTKLGRQFELIGCNREAARYSGIDVRKLRYLGYIVFGVMVTVASMFFIGRLSNGITCTSGDGYEFQVMVIATLGTIQINNRRPTVVGIVISSLVICSCNYVLGLLGLDAQTRQMLIGLIMIASVGVSKLNATILADFVRKLRYHGSVALEGEVKECTSRKREIRWELAALRQKHDLPAVEREHREAALRTEYDEQNLRQREAFSRYKTASAKHAVKA